MIALVGQSEEGLRPDSQCGLDFTQVRHNKPVLHQNARQFKSIRIESDLNFYQSNQSIHLPLHCMKMAIDLHSSISFNIQILICGKYCRVEKIAIHQMGSIHATSQGIRGNRVIFLFVSRRLPVQITVIDIWSRNIIKYTKYILLCLKILFK